ncbi:glycosyltransferase family 39 protein [Cyanobium sp. PCC 7001]|uniref:glycosyltransferase family 39 protein n=1 Tax=Cyanobium sp. PCC 7001 TaxID=180281 RepID=UPI0008FEFCD7|nr:glycosyltransferase family 39 protein [Cyanobium sp. PCC 7001]
MSPWRPRTGWGLLVLMVAAAALRFHDPGHQWLSHDEVYTALRTAGFPPLEPPAQLTAGELQQFLRLSADHGWSATLRELARHPEHPPLYFLLARLVREGFGEAMVSVRLLSALFSVLLVPAVYWLGWEVSGSLGLAALAAGMAVVSPLQLLYAQEARPYSLLVLLTALACAGLLRLRRGPGPLPFWSYVLTLVAGLYTSLIFVLVPLSHGLHGLLPGQPAGHRRRWGAAMAIALVAFLPWLWILGVRLEAFLRHTAWLRVVPPAPPDAWLRGLHWSAPFVDLGGQPPPWWPAAALTVVLALAGAGALVLARRTTSPGWSLLVLLLLLNLLVLEAGDLATGGRHAQMTRYLLPGLLGAQMLVAGALWGLVSVRGSRPAGVLLLVAALLAGALSCRSILAADTWWHQYRLYRPTRVQAALWAHPGSQLRLVRSPTSLGEAIALAQRLDPDTPLCFVAAPLSSGAPGPPAAAVVQASDLGQVVLPADGAGSSASCAGP